MWRNRILSIYSDNQSHVSFTSVATPWNDRSSFMRRKYWTNRNPFFPLFDSDSRDIRLQWWNRSYFCHLLSLTQYRQIRKESSKESGFGWVHEMLNHLRALRFICQLPFKRHWFGIASYDAVLLDWNCLVTEVNRMKRLRRLWTPNRLWTIRHLWKTWVIHMLIFRRRKWKIQWDHPLVQVNWKRVLSRVGSSESIHCSAILGESSVWDTIQVASRCMLLHSFVVIRSCVSSWFHSHCFLNSFIYNFVALCRVLESESEDSACRRYLCLYPDFIQQSGDFDQSEWEGLIWVIGHGRKSWVDGCDDSNWSWITLFLCTRWYKNWRIETNIHDPSRGNSPTWRSNTQ